MVESLAKDRIVKGNEARFHDGRLAVMAAVGKFLSSASSLHLISNSHHGNPDDNMACR
jgi:hypothetical protein